MGGFNKREIYVFLCRGSCGYHYKSPASEDLGTPFFKGGTREKRRGPFSKEEQEKIIFKKKGLFHLMNPHIIGAAMDADLIAFGNNDQITFFNSATF